MEILSIIFFGILWGIAVTIIFEFILKTNKKLRHRYYQQHEILFGYHVHHSTYGLLSIAAGIILLFNKSFSNGLFYIFFGLGIIIQHTLSANGRLVTIIKNKGEQINFATDKTRGA